MDLSDIWVEIHSIGIEFDKYLFKNGDFLNIRPICLVQSLGPCNPVIGYFQLFQYVHFHLTYPLKIRYSTVLYCDGL